ncbi:Phosphoadenosine phosphosulfate reductase family-domain-containing protein [Paraphysoderma sedebokerense]|nr:Phosphoadenosine phosphosulfate reductase family-domain-containing protein [Paraphysoderma sedebokerense]
MTNTLPPIVPLSATHIAHLNKILPNLHPKEILKWAVISFPNLFQISSFGPSGLVILDMISEISKELGPSLKQNEYSLPTDYSGNFYSPKQSPSSPINDDTPTTDKERTDAVESASRQPSLTLSQSNHLVPLIFIDTLYHFPETYDLITKIHKKYQPYLHIYKPENCPNVSTYESLHGPSLYTTKPLVYSYTSKVEPARRAYTELNVSVVINGRRRSQKGARENIPILEIEETGMIKINPLAYWSEDLVWGYIKENKLHYNVLHDKGYRSVGDWHSSSPAKEGDQSERSGRWRSTEAANSVLKDSSTADDLVKKECGLHVDYVRSNYFFLFWLYH